MKIHASADFAKIQEAGRTPRATGQTLTQKTESQEYTCKGTNISKPVQKRLFQYKKSHFYLGLHSPWCSRCIQTEAIPFWVGTVEPNAVLTRLIEITHANSLLLVQNTKPSVSSAMLYHISEPQLASIHFLTLIMRILSSLSSRFCIFYSRGLKTI